MKAKDVYTMLKTLKIPVAYDHFESNKNITPPFIVFRETDVDTFKADGISYYRDYNYEIELITEKKDTDLQEELETLLTTNKLPYDLQSELWDNNEKIYHNIYEI